MQGRLWPGHVFSRYELHDMKVLYVEGVALDQPAYLRHLIRSHTAQYILTLKVPSKMPYADSVASNQPAHPKASLSVNL